MGNSKLFILLVLLQISCKKEKSLPIINDSWKPVEEITLNKKNAISCYSDGNNLYINTFDYLLIYDKDYQLTLSLIYSYNKAYGYKRFPLEGEVLFEFSGDRLYYNPFLDLTSNGYQILMNNDSSFIGYDNYPNWNYTEAAFLNSNSKKQFLVKIKSKNNAGKLKLALIDITKYYEGKVSTYEFPDIYTNGTFLNSFINDKFYFSAQSHLYTIDTLGNSQKISDEAFNAITQVDNVLWGLSDLWYLKLSSDNGYTWIKSTLWLPGLTILNIDGKPIYFDNDQIGEFQINGTTINGKKINSKGLEGNEITYLCKHNKRYYCTTKSGVFYLEEEYFKTL